MYRALFLFALLALVAPISFAHGLIWEQHQGSVGLSFRYADGAPLRFAQAQVINPQGKLHQHGETDTEGRFAFIPAMPGRWQVNVTDGKEHHIRVELEVNLRLQVTSAIKGKWDPLPTESHPHALQRGVQ